jgi:signal transduction histidine kinase/HPt (histidine-containing phosphotransfer) domain-containing protein
MNSLVISGGALALGWALWRLQGLRGRLQHQERRLSESQAALVRADAAYQTLRAAMPEQVFRVTRGGRVLAEGSGRERDGSAPAHLDQLMPADDADRLEGHIEQVIGCGEPAEFAYRVRGREGESDFHVRVLRCAPEQAFLIVRDVTLEHQARRELAATREAASAVARAKTRFLANMSHELRTPMNGVIGMTNLLLETPLSPEQREYATIIQNSGELLVSLIGDILDFAKLEAGKLALEQRPFELRACVEESVAACAALAREKQLALSVQFEGSMPEVVSGDAARLRQVLGNLTRYAIGQTATGSVQVQVSHVGDEGELALLRFTLRDTSPGLSAQAREALFRPVLPDEGAGDIPGEAGLGLVLARELVRLMAGELSCESAPGAGTTFSISLRFPRAVVPCSGAVLPTPGKFADTEAWSVSSVEAALDPQGLAKLLEIGGGDAGFVREMIDLFLSQTPGNLDAMRAGLRAGDLLAVARAAHSTKSSSGYLGARQLSALCALVEAKAKARETAEVTRAVEILLAEFDVVRAALKEQRAAS